MSLLVLALLAVSTGSGFAQTPGRDWRALFRGDDEAPVLQFLRERNFAADQAPQIRHGATMRAAELGWTNVLQLLVNLNTAGERGLPNPLITQAAEVAAREAQPGALGIPGAFP